MKRYLKMLILIPLAPLLMSCADSDSATVNDNIFFQSGNDQIQSQASTQSFVGLWESESYEHNGLTTQIRWKLTENETILAKKCEGLEGEVAYVQVSLPLDNQLLESSDYTPFALPISSSLDKITKIQVMSDNRPCRVSIDPENIDQDSVIASGTDEYEIENMDVGDQIIDLNISEDNESISLRKIGF